MAVVAEKAILLVLLTLTGSQLSDFKCADVLVEFVRLTAKQLAA